MQSRRVRGHSAAYPIKLFYTSGVSIMLQLGLVSTSYFWSYVAQTQMKGSFFANVLGQWQELTPVGGLAYYLTAPSSFFDLFRDPQHFIIYTVFVLVSCSLFSKMWIDVSGSAPRDVCR
jgi:protein transport protein SEC61 subunit alpha